MMSSFAGKNYIVAGASSGMGKEIATELVMSGANVLGIAHTDGMMTELHIKMSNFIPCIVDVCDYNVMSSMIKQFVDNYGQISGAVYTAGITGLTPVKAFDRQLMRKILDVNFCYAMDFMQLLCSAKISKSCSSFVFFSSVAARKGEKGMFAYAAAKAALVAAVKSVAKEIAKRGQRINTVSPGRVLTPMTAGFTDDEVVKRHLLGQGVPEDVTGAVLFLLSDRARWITGTDLVVDGGYLVN